MRALFAAATVAAVFSAGDAGASPNKRDLPDFDGRGKPSVTASDVLLWPPRVVLFPLYLTSEYVLRRPIGAFATHAEKHHWPTHLIDFFTFDKEHKAGIVPTALYDFGFRPSVGLYFWWDDAAVKGHAVRFHFGTWGPEWLSAAAENRLTFNDGRATWSVRAEYTRRSDGLFAGLGPRSLEKNVARFGFRRLATSTAIDVRFWRSSVFRVVAGVRSLDFRDDQRCCGNPTMEQAVAAGNLQYPPGFLEGYTAVHNSIELAVDNRKPTGSLTGFRVAFDAEHGGDVREMRTRQWLKYSAVGGLFADVSHGRVIGIAFGAYFADPIGSSGEVPFTEQVSFPGPATLPTGLVGVGPMRGFRPGRLIDRSGMVVSLLYEWPIWVWLDGTIHLAAGNVYGKHLSDFQPKLTRFSTGVGFRTVGSPDHQFEVLVGTGTETIEDGAGITFIRVLAGATRGF